MAATLVASEWDNQETLLKQHSLPVVSMQSDAIAVQYLLYRPIQTSLASRAIDSFSDEITRAEVRAQLLKYLDTDTIWCALRRVISIHF